MLTAKSYQLLVHIKQSPILCRLNLILDFRYQLDLSVFLYFHAILQFCRRCLQNSFTLISTFLDAHNMGKWLVNALLETISKDDSITNEPCSTSKFGINTLIRLANISLSDNPSLFPQHFLSAGPRLSGLQEKRQGRSPQSVYFSSSVMILFLLNTEASQVDSPHKVLSHI